MGERRCFQCGCAEHEADPSSDCVLGAERPGDGTGPHNFRACTLEVVAEAFGPVGDVKAQDGAVTLAKRVAIQIVETCAPEEHVLIRVEAIRWSE